jgi:hypothetical protein
LDWLCFNLPGDELPLKFASAATSTSRAGIIGLEGLGFSAHTLLPALLCSLCLLNTRWVGACVCVCSTYLHFGFCMPAYTYKLCKLGVLLYLRLCFHGDMVGPSGVSLPCLNHVFNYFCVPL